MVNLRYFDGAIEKTRKRFLQLNIGKKMVLGFLPIFVLTILMAAYALGSLSRLNRINRSIVQVDVPLMQATDSMIDSLYSQELHGNHYIIIKSAQNMELFTAAGLEFKNEILKISGLPEKDQESIERISMLHDEYNAGFMDWFKSTETPQEEPVDYTTRIEEKQGELIDLIQQISNRASRSLEEKTQAASLIGLTSSRIFTIFCLICLLIGSAAGFAINRNISGAIVRLKDATLEIAKGKFDYIPEIRNQDELGELSHSFSEMAKRLKRLEEMYLDTSPLTHLPGGIAIENVLKKRIDSGQKFAFCLIDLDNFKVYNDNYGYARGNQVIKDTAQIIEKAVKKWGGEGAFYGHIGGDDFVVIAPLEQYTKICKFIVDEFDKTIDLHYDAKDLSLGSIIRKSRTGEEKKFPIMTISIGVVTNKKRKFRHFVQVGEIAAEVKNYAKSKPGSLYYVDRRKGDD